MHEPEEIATILAEQHGVISRRQVLEAGLDDRFLARAVRRRLLRRVVDGVYVDHTGPLTWWQRAWVALLDHAPAALAGRSCLRAEGLRSAGPDTGPIELAVEHSRRLTRQAGAVLRRKRSFADAVHPSRTPPRLRLEEALLDVASEAPTDEEAIAVLADAVQERRTTAGRLLDVVRNRDRLRRRAFLLEVLEDVAAGAYSVLEQRYLTRVERPHGLPTARRQRRVRRGRTVAFRDVEYLGMRTVVELDGRLGHEPASDRWDDLDRDVASAVDGDTTIRLGWRQVLSPCRVALALATVLCAKGWAGTLRPCSATCTAVVRGAQHARGA